MRPSTILALYLVGLNCFALGTMGVLFGIAYSWGFWPRFFAYARRSAP